MNFRKFGQLEFERSTNPSVRPPTDIYWNEIQIEKVSKIERERYKIELEKRVAFTTRMGIQLHNAYKLNYPKQLPQVMVSLKPTQQLRMKCDTMHPSNNNYILSTRLGTHPQLGIWKVCFLLIFYLEFQRICLNSTSTPIVQWSWLSSYRPKFFFKEWANPDHSCPKITSSMLTPPKWQKSCISAREALFAS